MFVYIAVLVAILIGLIREQLNSDPYSPRMRGVGAFCVVMALGLVVGLRDMIGGYDVYVYANIFENLAKTQEFSMGMFFSPSEEDRVMGVEPGWTLYNRIIGFFTSDKYAFFFVTAVFSYLALFRHLRKYAPYFFFALLIIFCRQFLQSFIYVRQFMACMVVWFALDFAQKRKIAPFFLVVWVAANIHICGLIFVVVYPLARWKIPTLVMLSGFTLALILGLTPAFGVMLESFGGMAGSAKAVGYGESVGGGAHLFYMVEALLIATALLLVRSSVYGVEDGVLRDNGMFAKLGRHIPRVAAESDARSICLFNVAFLYVCASLTTLQSPGCMRLIWVFWIGPICMLPYICEKMIAGAGQAFFKFLIILYFIVAFWLFAFRFDNGDLLNYRTFLFQ